MTSVPAKNMLISEIIAHDVGIPQVDASFEFAQASHIEFITGRIFFLIPTPTVISKKRHLQFIIIQARAMSVK